jgi:isopenicillin N synthase-like dioxygenase
MSGGTDADDDQVIDLPILDVSQLNQETGKKVLDASAEYGFLYLATDTTPFTSQLIARTFQLSKSLFELPLSEKSEYWIESATNRGYTGVRNEILDPESQVQGDLKEAWNFGETDGAGSLQQPVPKSASLDVSQGVKDFEEACKATCERVLDLLALGLELKDDDVKWFSSKHHQPSGSIVRFLRYPPVDEKDREANVGAGAHSDYGSVTLLFQQPGGRGLEIRGPDGSWKGVEVIPKGYKGDTPPIVVNIGDLLSYWTKGLLKSTVHRVMMPPDATEDRYSIAYFCHPNDEQGLVAVPSHIVAERGELREGESVGYGGGADGKALTAKEHLMRRLEATYGSRK